MSRREHTCRKGVGEGPGWILGRGYQEDVVLGAEGVGGSSDREENGDKQVRGQGKSVMRPQSVKKRNYRGKRVRSLRRG